MGYRAPPWLSSPRDWDHVAPLSGRAGLVAANVAHSVRASSPGRRIPLRGTHVLRFTPTRAARAYVLLMVPGSCPPCTTDRLPPGGRHPVPGARRVGSIPAWKDVHLCDASRSSTPVTPCSPQGRPVIALPPRCTGSEGGSPRGASGCSPASMSGVASYRGRGDPERWWAESAHLPSRPPGVSAPPAVL